MNENIIIYSFTKKDFIFNNFQGVCTHVPSIENASLFSSLAEADYYHKEKCPGDTVMFLSYIKIKTGIVGNTNF